MEKDNMLYWGLAWLYVTKPYDIFDILENDYLNIFL